MIGLCALGQLICGSTSFTSSASKTCSGIHAIVSIADAAIVSSASNAIRTIAEIRPTFGVRCA